MTNRKRFIVDMVEKYKKDYPEDYKHFLALMEQRRSELDDKKFAKVKGATEMRKALQLPAKFMNIMQYVFNGVDEDIFLEPKGEMKWFIKKYPEFLLSNSY